MGVFIWPFHICSQCAGQHRPNGLKLHHTTKSIIRNRIFLAFPEIPFILIQEIKEFLYSGGGCCRWCAI